MLRRLGPVVGHQRVGGEGDGFVKNKEGENVGGKGDAHGPRNGEGEADVETGLVFFVVTTHIADRVQRGHDPQPRRHEGEKHPQRLDLECEIEAGQDLDNVEARPAPHHHRRQDDFRDDGEERACGKEGRGLADVRPAPQEGDQNDAEERPHNRQADGGLDAHSSTPNSIRAAAEARPTESEVNTPKKTVAPARTQIGTNRPAGASLTSGASSGGWRK